MTVKKGVWTLREFSPEGKETMLTCNSALDRAICQHMLYSIDEKNKLVQLLGEELLKFGPVWLAPLPSFSKGDKSIAYSPAGKLLAIRLLISSGNDSQKHLKTIQGMLEYHDPETSLNLKMHDFYETSLIITRDNGTNYWHMAFVAEYVVPLAFVYDTVKLFHVRGLISLNGLDRIMIQDATFLTESEEMSFYLNTIPGAKTFTVLLKGLLKSHEYFAKQLKNYEQKYQVGSF